MFEPTDEHLNILKHLSMAPWNEADQLPDLMIVSQEFKDLLQSGLIEISPYGSQVRYILSAWGVRLVCQHLTLAERIAHGRTTMLDTNKICERLGVSRTTFERWQRAEASGSSRATRFPKPDIYIAGHPRWELTTLTQWLVERKEQTDGK